MKVNGAVLRLSTQPNGRAIFSRNVSGKRLRVLAALRLARRDLPNGMMLQTGEFIHLRPYGMAQLGLGVGAKVSAVSESLIRVLGARSLKALEVNRMELV